MGDLEFLRGEVVGDLGFSMNTKVRTNKEKRKREKKEKKQQPEKHDEGNQRTRFRVLRKKNNGETVESEEHENIKGSGMG